eukprot:1321205-Rhodomonas_salina.1
MSLRNTRDFRTVLRYATTGHTHSGTTIRYVTRRSVSTQANAQEGHSTIRLDSTGHRLPPA